MNNRHLLAAAALVTALCGLGAAASAQTDSAGSPATAASAAPFQQHHHHPGRMMRALRSVGLSSAQRTQIRTILQNARAAKASGTPQTHRQVLSQIENVLTPDQRMQFEAALKRPPTPQDRPQAQPQATP